MKKGAYILQIPEPCHENWQNMTPDGKGRFCAHCTKTVIDFTQFSDEQIIAHIHQQNGHLCGRFNQNQLNRNIQAANSRKLKQNRLQGFIAGVLLLLTAGNANAGEVIAMKTEVVQHKDILPESLSYVDSIEAPKDTLKGTVVDSFKNEPLPFATILNKNNRKGTKTNFDGMFEVPASIGDTIQVSCVDYGTKTIVIKTIIEPLIVSLEIDSSAFRGIITMGWAGYHVPLIENPIRVPAEKHRLRHKIRHFFGMKPRQNN